MKIRIGILKPTPVLVELLNQEMVPWDCVKWNNISLDYFSTIIVNEKLPMIERDRLIDFVKQGGTVLTSTQFLDTIIKVKTAKISVKWLHPDNLNIMQNNCLLDIYDYIYLADTTKVDWVDKGLFIQKKQLEEGLIVSLPYDLDKLISSSKVKRKQFYDTTDELPSERVAKVSKGTIRQVFVNALRYLADFMNLPYCHLSYNMGNQRNFIFRIDTDFCSSKDARDLYNLLRENDIKGTWFVDTADKSMLSDLYGTMEDQEIGLHCKRHLVFPDYKSNLSNISAGLDALSSAGIEAQGFAAPYGEWNNSLNRVLQEKGFVYSSEFGWDYDNLPSYPIVSDNRSSVLQIPIHPISIGRLIRSHYKPDQIFNYFKELIDLKLSANVPVVIYYHPHKRCHDLLQRIFRYVKQRKLQSITMGEYAKWWKIRMQTNYEVEFQDGTISVISNNTTNPILVVSNRKNARLESNGTFKLDELQWNMDDAQYMHAVEKARSFCWRNMLYNFESFKGKLKQ